MFFAKPLKSATKATKDRSPEDSSTLQSMSPKPPSRTGLKELAVDVSKMPAMLEAMSLTQSDPSIAQTSPLPEYVSTPQSIKSTTRTSPISTKDDAASIPLQKDTEASVSPSVPPKDSTTLTPVLPEEKLSMFEFKKPEPSKSPTEPRISLPVITKPPDSFQKPIKRSRSLTWPDATSSKEHGTLPLQAPKEMSPLQSLASSKKPKRKRSIRPMEITGANPEQVSIYLY